MQGFDFSQVRRQLALAGWPGRIGSDGTLTLVPTVKNQRRDDLRAVWGADDQGNLYCDLGQVHGHAAGFDVLAALATNIPCAPGSEVHVAGKIASLMASKVATLARSHPAPVPILAMTA